MSYDLWRRLMTGIACDLHKTRQCIAYWKRWPRGTWRGVSPEVADGFVAFYRSRWAFHMNELRQLRCLSELS